ncbi:MAG: CoA pyrophosphatase, partial [Bacteroidota bacterium]
TYYQRFLQMEEEFASFLRTELNKKLPGDQAHAQMTDNIKLRQVQQANSTPRKAGVLILIYPHQQEFYIPFILRPIYDGAHSGQIAFPGGRTEKEDLDIKHTALRETHEEIGVIVNRNAIVGTLSDLYIPPSNSLVTPTVAVISQKPDFIPDAREVDQVLEFPLYAFQNPYNQQAVQVELPNGLKLKTPGFLIENSIIWGATAMMMNELLYIVKKFFTQ